MLLHLWGRFGWYVRASAVQTRGTMISVADNAPRVD